MPRRKPPKRAKTISIEVTVVIEAAMELIRDDVKKQLAKLDWQYLGALDGPSLRIRYSVPIKLE
jgi:hypothetical protein